MSTESIASIQEWFAHHVTLFDAPYTLNQDQIRAVTDSHQNTLVTARAGSGKTRVIVAKIVYLLAKCGYQPKEIAVFMFNRTAAAEVNQRLLAVRVDGQSLFQNSSQPPRIASTFHKYALDLIKLTDEQPSIVSEAENTQLVRQAFEEVLAENGRRVSPREFTESLAIVQGFINRAGQKFPGLAGLDTIREEVAIYAENHKSDPEFRRPIYYHQLAAATYAKYLQSLQPPQTNFNLLMHHAAQLLSAATGANFPKLLQKVLPLKILMIDEYQDFSYLFFNLVLSLRKLLPDIKLFAVGDDWQAINRFAGSDVDYFINFADYFLEDVANIPLATNYRSSYRIVKHANQYMLKNYDPTALPAIPKSRHAGKVITIDPSWTRFNKDDLKEDALGDGRFMKLLLSTTAISHPSPEAARLLKLLLKLIQRHRHSSILILHRHNFTSYPGLNLENLATILGQLVVSESIMNTEAFNSQVRCLTIHKSKGLEADVVILLEMNHSIVSASHPHATLFEIFGDNLESERADQQRLLYVALTRAKNRLYILSHDESSPVDLTSSKLVHFKNRLHRRLRSQLAKPTS